MGPREQWRGGDAGGTDHATYASGEHAAGRISGPAGAIAVLNYPPVVKATTYFNHVEIHSEPNGHPNNPGYVQANRYLVPNFDFHFYGILLGQVLTIPFGFFFEQASADRLPN